MIIINNKQTKGSIPINDKLLNKYDSVEEIIKKERYNYKTNIIISNNLLELDNKDINNMKIKELKDLAYEIFCNYHSQNIFVNNKNNIVVSRRGINESVEKIYYNRIQRDLLLEHLKVFGYLGIIIEKAKLVNQVYERKGRLKYNSWNYYLDGIIIGNQEYLIEFEVVSMDNFENHYRIQRLEPK